MFLFILSSDLNRMSGIKRLGSDLGVENVVNLYWVRFLHPFPLFETVSVKFLYIVTFVLDTDIHYTKKKRYLLS